MTDTGQDIDFLDEMTIVAIENICTDVNHRATILKIEGNYALVQWRNFYKTATGKRSKDAKGNWKLLELQRKRVKLL
jgi:hypothetical protein